MADGNSGFNERLEKADADLARITPNGVLVPEQAEKFWEVVTKRSKLLRQCTIVTMSNPTYEQSKVDPNGEILHPAAEATALAPSDRWAPAFSKVVLSPKEYIGHCQATYSAIEDNVQRDNFVPFLVDLMGRGVRGDIEKAVIQGDTAGSGSPFMRSIDGIIKQITTNTPTASGARLSKTHLTSMLRALPEEYMQDDSNWGIFTNKNAAVDQWAEFSDRETAGGDEARQRGREQYFFGMKVDWLPFIPRNYGGGSNETVALLMDPTNVLVGYRRDVSIEYVRDIKRRVFDIVVTVRFDAKLLHEPATVKLTNVLASA